MKGLLLLALCAVLPYAVSTFEVRGNIINPYEVNIINKWIEFQWYEPMTVYYQIRFPMDTGMVHLMMTDAFEGDVTMYTTCGDPSEGEGKWRHDLNETRSDCSRVDFEGQWMIECNGHTEVTNPSLINAPQFFMLVKCGGTGLMGTSYKLWNYDMPVSASVSGAVPSVVILSLATLVSYLRLL